MSLDQNKRYRTLSQTAAVRLDESLDHGPHHLKGLTSPAANRIPNSLVTFVSSAARFLWHSTSATPYNGSVRPGDSCLRRVRALASDDIALSQFPEWNLGRRSAPENGR